MLKIGGHCQLAQERAVALHLHRAHRYFRATADEVEQTDAEVAGETLVDDLHGRHATPDDLLLAGDVVVADFSGLENGFYRLLALAGDPFEQGIDFFLGEK